MLKIRIKNKNRSILVLIIVLTAFFEHKAFGLIPVNNSVLKYFEMLSVFAAFIFSYVKKRSLHYLEVSKYLHKYTVLFLAFLFTQLIYVVLKYGEGSFFSFFQAGQQYFWIILAIPIYCVFIVDNGVKKLCNVFSFITFIVLLILLVSSLLYNVAGVKVFSVFDQWTIRHMRNGRIRVWDLSSLEGLSAIWLFYKILFEKEKIIWSTFQLVVIVFALIYLEQTRMMQLSVLLSCGSMYLMRKENKKYTKLFKGLVIALIILFIVVFNPVDILLDSFSTSGQYAGSTIVRLNAIEYCFQIIKENPINGTGLVSGSVRDTLLSYTGRGRLSYTDIGVIGLYAQIGVWAIAIYILPLAHFTKILFRLRAPSRSELYYFMFGNLIYLFITSLTLLVLNVPRAYAWPLYLALFEYFRRENKL